MRAFAALAALWIALAAYAGHAHDSRPLFVEITEGEAGGVTLL